MGDLQLCWMGDFKQLKQFINENIELNAVWNSPGGDKKTYSDGHTSISWRKNKKVLQIEGKEKDRIKSKLCSVLCNVHSHIPAKESVATDEGSGNSSLTLSGLSADMEGIKHDTVICEREIETNRHTIRNLEDRLNKVSGNFEEVSNKLDNMKELYFPHNQHVSQSAPLFEYSNLLEKDLPRPKTLCYDKSTSTKDLIVNNQNQITVDELHLSPTGLVPMSTYTSVNSTCAVQILKPSKHAIVNHSEKQINQSSATNTFVSNLIPRTVTNSTYSNEFKRRQNFCFNLLNKGGPTEEGCHNNNNNPPRVQCKDLHKQDINQAIPTRITYRIPSKVRANRQQGFRPSYARRRTDWIQHLDLVHRILNPLMQ
jgi:hypothetical protein